MRAPSRILIVGGGIAGLALGRALRAQGFDPEIIERAASWPTGGTGLYIPGNGVRALGALGLADEVLARAVRMSHQRILDHKGRRLAEIELEKFWSPVGPCVGIARAELHRILLEGAGGRPDSARHLGDDAAQESDEVHVVFADGSTGTYDLVVGADGIHSSIRQLVFAHRSAVSRPGELAISRRSLRRDQKPGRRCSGRRRAFLTMPVGPNRLYCYADLAAVATEDPTGRIRLDCGRSLPIRRTGARHPPQARELRLHPLLSHRGGRLDTGCRGRVVLVGDAAHATSPNMAEGARWRSRMRWCWPAC